VCAFVCVYMRVCICVCKTETERGKLKVTDKALHQYNSLNKRISDFEEFLVKCQMPMILNLK
jgi:hypothetical protein